MQCLAIISTCILAVALAVAWTKLPPSAAAAAGSPAIVQRKAHVSATEAPAESNAQEARQSIGGGVRARKRLIQFAASADQLSVPGATEMVRQIYLRQRRRQSDGALTTGERRRRRARQAALSVKGIFQTIIRRLRVRWMMGA